MQNAALSALSGAGNVAAKKFTEAVDKDHREDNAAAGIDAIITNDKLAMVLRRYAWQDDPIRVSIESCRRR